MKAQISQRMEKVPLAKDTVFYQGMEEYFSVKINCLSSYRTTHDIQKELKACSDYLKEWPGDRLMMRANTAGDPETVLELAIRYLSGCGVAQKNYEGALYVLDALLDASCDPSRYVGDRAPPALLAQAHSLAARAHFEKLLAFDASPAARATIYAQEARFARREPAPLFGTTRLEAPLSYLAHAAHHANEAARLSLVSPTVLVVGMRLRDVGEAVGVDLAQMGGAKRFRTLWRAVARREREVHNEERKRRRKAESAPNRYACAREGCGIRAEARRALLACSGRCPQDLKPSYCSKECQKQDWPKHKAICKPLAERKPKVTDKDKARALFEIGEAEDGVPPDDTDDVDDDDDTLEVEGKEEAAPVTNRDRTIEIPAPSFAGGSIQVTSQTMDPALMREFRDEVANRIKAVEKGV